MVLLDTCTLLWLAADQKHLSQKAINTISKNASALYISCISSFEIAIKYQKEKLILPFDPEKWIPDIIEHHGIKEIPVDSAIAVLATKLPAIHNDPADRIIIATSITHNMTLLTPDPFIKKYPRIIVKW